MFDPATLTLVAITDDLRDGIDGLVLRAVLAVRGGATMVQLRLKETDARTQVDIARRLVAAVAVPVTVNDRADIALAAGAAGVHLGADDLPVAVVRRIAGDGFIIGASVGEDQEVPLAARADYVGIGPVFGSATKLDAGAAIGVTELARLARACAPVPAVAIGGITAEGAAEVLAGAASAGVHGVAVVREVFGAPAPDEAARAIRRAMGR
jgi:thiamine-phosphate pyrophosphorylase